MEILQTIWNSLTTPNEFLITILGIPLIYLEAFIGMLFFTTILNINVSKKQKLIYVLIYGTISNIINFIVPTLYTFFVILIVWPIIIKLTLKTSVLKSILAEISTYAITIIFDFIVANTFLPMFGVVSEQILVIPLYRYSAMLSIYLLIFIITFIIRYFKINIEVFDNMPKKNKTLLVINSILLILVLGMQAYLITFFADTMPTLITMINIIGIIAYFVTTIYSVVSSSKLEIASRDLESAQLRIHSLKVLHDTVRTFKHDFDNIINGIGGYIRNNDMEGLEKYYNQLLIDCKKTNNLYSLSPDVINHPAIYNILATKYYVADELNIHINLDVFLDLNEIEKNMKIYEFTRMLGILLDNAIESASECEEKIINVIFRKEDVKHRLVVIIENTYKNKDVDINKIFDKGETSKENNSGLGLWKVREILKKNNNLNLYTTKTDELFKQQFEIYY